MSETIPYGYCHCGCGERTKPAPKSDKYKGHVLGEPMRYVQHHHTRTSGVDFIEDPETGCWIWQRATIRGYGSLTFERARWLAHRLYYEDLIGPIPDALELDHLCFTPACVNPGHVEPVTHEENARRFAATITHCPHGHPYDEANTHWRKRGGRDCRTCARLRMRRRREGVA